MLEQLLRRRRQGGPEKTTSSTAEVPSPVAQARLSGALREQADAYRDGAGLDLKLVDVLVRLDEHEAAAKTLDDHRASLQAMAHGLQVAVADAAVEREAERVYSTHAATLASTPSDGRHRRAGRLQRRIVALAGAAAVVLAMMAPTQRIWPRTNLTSVGGEAVHDEAAAARERLDAARSWARSLRADHQEPDAARRNDVDLIVRRHLRAVLSEGVAGRKPEDRVSRGGPPPRPDDQAPDAGVVSDVRKSNCESGRLSVPESDELAPVIPLRPDLDGPVAAPDIDDVADVAPELDLP